MYICMFTKNAVNRNNYSRIQIFFRKSKLIRCLILQGAVVFGHFGRPIDVQRLSAGNVSLAGSTLLLQMGKTSVTEKVNLGSHGSGKFFITLCLSANLFKYGKSLECMVYKQ